MRGVPADSRAIGTDFTLRDSRLADEPYGFGKSMPLIPRTELNYSVIGIIFSTASRLNCSIDVLNLKTPKLHNADSITNADWNFLRDCTPCSLIVALIKSREIGMAPTQSTLTDCPLIKRPTLPRDHS